MAEEIKKEIDEEIDEENVDVDNQGTEDEAGANQNKGSDKGNDNSGKRSGKTFSQEQVTKMMTREKSQGRNAALKELGIDLKNSKMVEAVKAYIESLKTEDDKNAEKDNELSEANNRARIAEAKAEAMMIGIKPQYVEDAVTLVLSKVKADDDNDSVKTALGELKAKYPVWFGEKDEDDNSNVGKRGTGSSIGAQRKGANGGKQEQSLGARLAACMFSTTLTPFISYSLLFAVSLSAAFSLITSATLASCQIEFLGINKTLPFSICINFMYSKTLLTRS